MNGRRRGFTFMEVMVVLLIIGLITAIVGPNLYDLYRKQKRKAAEIQIKTFHETLAVFHLNHGRFPTAEEGLEALLIPPRNLPKPELFPEHGYLNGDLPSDPWDRPYLYVAPGRQGAPYDIVSQGEDPDSETDDLVSPKPGAFNR